MKKEIYLIDAHAYIHRAFHALPPFTTSKGLMVNALYGFLRFLIKLIKEKKPDYIGICFDYPAPTFRHKKFPEYKATRKEIDLGLKDQLPLTRKTIEDLGFPVYEKSGFEADDVIGTLARQANENGLKTIIVTGDKDSLQLVNKDTVVWNESKGIIWDEEKIENDYGIKPNQFIDLYALMGDTSDNIPGVRGIGEKTALKLIQKYETVANLLDNVNTLEGKLKEKLTSGKEAALFSYELVKIDNQAPVTLDLKYSKAAIPEASEKVLSVIKELEFSSLYKELQSAQRVNIEETEYKTLYAINEIENLINRIKEKKIFVFDVETDSLDIFNAKVAGISFSFEAAKAFYIPFKGAGKTMSFEKVINFIKPLFNDSSIKKIGHNIKFDCQIFKNNNINVEGVYFDTMIASYLINPTRSSNKLKDLAYDYFHIPMTRFDQIVDVKGKDTLPISEIDIDKMSSYSCADADFTWRLYEVFKEELKKLELEELFFQIEMPIVNIISDMELSGIKIDEKILSELSVELKKNLDRTQLKIYETAGKEFNISSPKQLSHILFEKFQLPVIKKTKTGFSTDETVLVELSKIHPLPKLILEYRESQKLKSTYVDAILEKLRSSTARLHAKFNQAVTATGRLSSSDPNLQNIPIRKEIGRSIRRAFVPEEGCVFLSADYSQIDLRVLAHISEDPVLIDAFLKHEDIHKRTAGEIFHLSINQVSDDLRDKAKAINFGIVYGQKAFGLSQSLGIELRDADDYINKYFERYSGVKNWIENNINSAKRTGQVRTICNRIRFVNEINSNNQQLRNAAERLATNTPIQGSSADIIKVAMIKIYDIIKEKSLKTKILLQVHDDLLFEVPEAELDEVKSIVVREMEGAVKLKVPLKVSMAVGKNWGDMDK
ncbi:MAG: DNA polymerase I [bacterium]